MKDKVWVAAAFVLTFAAGVLVGAIIVRHFGAPRLPMAPFSERGDKDFPMHGERPPLPSLDMLQSQLALNEAQQEQVAIIVEKYRQEMLQHVGRIRPAMHDMLGKMRMEIESVLTPEQLEKFRREFPRPERRFGRRYAPRDSMPGKPE